MGIRKTISKKALACPMSPPHFIQQPQEAEHVVCMHFYQETYANPEIASAGGKSTPWSSFAHLPVLSMHRALEEVSFKRTPFIISRTPEHPVPPPRGHSLQLNNAPFQQGVSVYRRAFQMMTVSSFTATSPSRRCGCLCRTHELTGQRL